MKIISKNIKQGEISIKPENLDDLWCISTITDKGDLISGKTTRKITLGDKATEKTKVIKKIVNLTIQAEKIEFEEHLKILGTVAQGPEDIPIGAHHSFNIEENDIIKIKKNWLNYQIKKLEESANKKEAKIIACLYNREEAIFAKFINNNFQIISTISGNVAKKGDDTIKTSNFFKEIVKQLEELQKRFDAKHVIYASSHFWKKNIEDELGDLKKHAIFAAINDISEKGLSELLTRPELESALSDQQAIKDSILIEEVFSKIAKDEPVCYGIKDCSDAASANAIQTLLCTEDLIKKERIAEKFEELEEIFKATEKSGAEIKLLSGKNEHIQKLNGLGGIAAILRYKLN